MRIAYLCPDRGISLARTNGSAAHVRNMVRSMSELGHEVILLIGSREGTSDLGVEVCEIALPESYRALRSILRRQPIPQVEDGAPNDRIASSLGHIWQGLAVEQALARVLERGGIDMVYERLSPFAATGGLMASRRGVRHVLEVNAPLAWQGARYRGQALNEAAALLESVAVMRTDMIRAISDELREGLVAAGADPERIRTVPCGVDTTLFRPDVECSIAELQDRFVIGFVGSLKPWHGLGELTAAFRILAADPAYHLLIVGTGPEARLVQSLAADLPGRVTHIESVSHHEVPGYLKAMDVSVAPYPRLERFFFSPLKVLEAMAVGQPVVASSIGQIRELVEDGETGLLIPPGDVESIVAATRRLRADPALARRLGDRAAVEARERHCWSRRATDIVALAESV